jgi:hypothetical protein
MPTYSDRGFARWEPVSASYGAEINVYESSAAEGPHIWINIAADCHLEEPPRDHPSVPYGIATGSAAAHLSMEQAHELRDKLDAAIRHSEATFE